MGEALSGLDDGKSHGEGSGDGPSDGVLLSQLIQLLSRRPKQSLLLSDLVALLPGSLRNRAKEKGGLGQWIQMYGSLFRIDGQPGKEVVILTIQSMGSDPGLEGAEQASAQAGYPLPPGFSQQEDAATPQGGQQAQAAAAQFYGGEEMHTAPGWDGEADYNASALAVPFDEEVEGHLAIQLRGLPYKATVEDVRSFLGGHAANLSEENPIHLVLNRDGRPSGFARVMFNSPEAARTCRDELHLRGMDDRYVEVFLYPERPSKGRSRRIEDGSASERALTLADAAGVTKEQVVRECRNEMSAPGKRRMLLSMLGVTLSTGSRAYLKQIDQGLKHFLAQFPVEFAVEGAKGCEYVTYSPIHLSEAISSGAGPVAPGYQRAGASSTGGPAAAGPCSEGKVPPTSPKPCRSPAPQDGMASAGRGLATPSDWGTPAPGHGGSWGASMLNNPPNGAAWNVPPWPGAGAGPGNSEGGAGGAGEDENAWASQNWPFMPPLASSGMQWPGAVAPWNGDASSFSSWCNPGAAAFDQAAAAAQQNAAAAAALSTLGLDPAALAALASAYGAAAAAAAAGGGAGAPGVQPPGPVAPQAQQQQQCQQQHSASMGQQQASANSGGYSVEGGVAAIRLRGLPFTSTEQDVLAFFAQHDVVDRISDGPKAVNLLTRSNGRSSGQAVVNMRDRTDAELAQRVLNGQWMGNRYIEVFLHGDETTEPQNALAAATAAVTAAANSPNGPQPAAKAAAAAPNGAAAAATPLSLAGNLMQGQTAGQGGASAGTPPDPAALAGSQEFMAQYASMQAAAWQQQQQNLWQGLAGGSPMMPGLTAPACGGSGTQSHEWQALFSFLGDGSGSPAANAGAAAGSAALQQGAVPGASTVDGSGYCNNMSAEGTSTSGATAAV